MIRPVHLLSDDEMAALMATDDSDLVAQARIIVDDYDGFVAAGGSAMLVHEIVKREAVKTEVEQGVSPGESVGSSTS